MTDRAASDQQAFSRALLDPSVALPAGVRGPGSKAASRRFAVYRNNVAVGLVDALCDIFPTVRNLVGDTFFRSMARVFIAQCPPKSPVIAAYGAEFPAFLSTFEPIGHLFFLSDVARLERLWLDCYHEADTEPMKPSVLQALAPADLADLRLAPHPALRIASFSVSAVAIVSRDRSGEPLGGLDPSQPEWALLTRPAFDVELRHLDRAGAAFIDSIASGQTLGDAAAAAFSIDPAFPLPTAIRAIVEAGCFTGPRSS